MKMYPVLTSILLLSAFTAGTACAAEGGVSISGTRLVFDGRKDAASVTVSNTSASDVWLMRFWISPYADDSVKTASMPFVVTPPLYRLDPKAAIQLRVNKLPVPAVPADRESVYYLNNLAIPPKKGEEHYAKSVKSGLQFAVNSRIKLFYRPAALNDAAKVAAAPSALTAGAQGNDVMVKNPTPYFITLVNITINGRAVAQVEDPMIAPFGELKLNSSATHGTLKYSTVNDWGMTTAPQTKSF